MTENSSDIIAGLMEDAETALAAGQIAKALTLYQGILANDPDHVLALRQAGAIMIHQNNAAAALSFFERAARRDPADPDLYHGLATALRLQGQTDQAMLALQGALRLDPSHPPALFDLGVLKRLKGDYGTAERLLHAAASGTGQFEAIFQRAIALFRQDRLPEAERWFHWAGLINPSDPRPFINVAVIYRTWGHFDSAIKWLEKAIALDPESVEAHWNLANVRLVRGDLPQGFQLYEWRFRRPGQSGPNTSLPRWAGESLSGKTLILMAEQGIGDVIHFARFAKQLAARGARVVIQCHPGLEELLATVPGVSATVALGSPLPVADFSLPIMSLPLILGTTLETIPGEVPYLSVTPATRVGLPPSPGLKVGLVWRGNPRHENDRFRSIPLAVLEPILRVPGVTFYSLQVEQELPEIRALPTGVTVHELGPLVAGFSSTAAVVKALDLVITVDTAMAHLSGALGQKTWVMLGRGNDWRWLHLRSDSPWYPTVRLFRQGPPRDWGPVVKPIAHELQKLASSGP
ncbi:MAG: tetratricopeptide repeat-containing glycosyltransferase family protein [Rhodospirillaceae bacterium]|nr:tetratricopeptide repeat-containing glycosyltransferase family protein [Rhodospirillaceae bacterium]